MATLETAETTVSSIKTKEEEGDVTEAQKQLVQGKRHMLVQDFVSAVTSLEEACKGFAKHYGETANECGEPYLCYGKALLELARMETGVLGNALQGVADSDDEVTAENESKESDDDQVENPDNVTDDEDDDGDESESIGEKSQDETNPEDTEAGPSGSKDAAGADKEAEEDVSNLQLAWEVLDLAKVIFERQSLTDKEMWMKLSEVLLKLGEVSIESENYRQAIEDLDSCLVLQKKHLASHDRAVAETFYQLGLAYSFDNQFETAVDHFTKSIQVLEERIANCRLTIEQAPKEVPKEGENLVEVAKKEIEELEGLLPEIKTKIEDTEDMAKNAKEALKEAALQRLQEASSLTDIAESPGSAQNSPSKPTTNVTHLVKRKRKPEEDNAEDGIDNELKKPRANDGNNLEAKLNGESKAVTNGNSSSKPMDTENDLVADTPQPKHAVEGLAS